MVGLAEIPEEEPLFLVEFLTSIGVGVYGSDDSAQPGDRYCHQCAFDREELVGDLGIGDGEKAMKGDKERGGYDGVEEYGVEVGDDFADGISEDLSSQISAGWSVEGVQD